MAAKILEGGGDLQMVPCHSMNVGSVVGGKLKSYLMQKNLFELFTFTGSGVQKLRAQVSEPPGETFTNYFKPIIVSLT